HVNGAVYRGLTFLADPSGNFLLANDFRNNRIDVFDDTFKQVTLAAGQFADRNIPSGFAPFNVQAIGTSVYVAYARQDSSGSEAGSDAGFVDVFTNFGRSVSRIVSGSGARAPWGLAIAPSNWGAIAGDLLVGSFHDGFIYVYNGTTFVGQLGTPNNGAVRIDGLWALTPGNPQNGGVGGPTLTTRASGADDMSSTD